MPHSMPHGDLASYRMARVAFRAVCAAMLVGAGWAVYALVADTEANLYAIGEVAILGLILLVAFGPSLYQMARALRQIDIRAIRGLSLLPAIVVFFLLDDSFGPTWGPDQPTFGGEVGFPAVSFLIAAVFRIGLNTMLMKATGTIDDRPAAERVATARQWWQLFAVLVWLSVSGVVEAFIDQTGAMDTMGAGIVAIIGTLTFAALVYWLGARWLTRHIG
jgi:membrane protein YdbS with pleckstrin-like domain